MILHHCKEKTGRNDVKIVVIGIYIYTGRLNLLAIPHIVRDPYHLIKGSHSSSIATAMHRVSIISFIIHDAFVLINFSISWILIDPSLLMFLTANITTPTFLFIFGLKRPQYLEPGFFLVISQGTEARLIDWSVTLAIDRDDSCGEVLEDSNDALD